MEKVTKEVIGLFKWCYAKDVFQEFYLRGLSRRMLLKKSSSIDSERVMIARLRPECGTEFSVRSDAMIKDFSDSNSLNTEYRHIHKEKEGDIESLVHVLSQAHWPITLLQSKIAIPDQLSSIQTDFEKFYRLRFSGRCLSFATHMATCILSACFDGKNVKQLEVSGL